MGIVTAYMSVSLDGYGAGPNQSREKPFGDGGDGLHRWMFEDADEHADGGAATINQYLAIGAIDRLRLDIVPFVLGSGTRLFEGVPPFELTSVSAHHTPETTHLTYGVRRA